MRNLWGALMFFATLPTFAATRVSVQQLQQLIATASGQTDRSFNQALQRLELTERLNADQLASWQAKLPGPATRQTLQVLADESAFLRPPASELPIAPTPSLAEQRRMIALSADFAKKTISHLPDFYAARETLRFESDPASQAQPELPHPLDRSTDTILYRNGQEVVRLSAEERKRYGLATPGLSTSGVFGPMLGSVLTDVANGTLAWSHWERSGKPVAVFSYKIPQSKSHYRVELGLEYRDHPAYHGEFAIDPESGTILRLTMEADFEKNSVVVRSAVSLDYGPVTIGDRTYLCPLKSVTIHVFYPACTTTQIGACGALAHVRGFRTQTSLNDVTFSQYHVFRANTRILNADDAASPNAPPAAPGGGLTAPSETPRDAASTPESVAAAPSAPRPVEVPMADPSHEASAKTAAPVAPARPVALEQKSPEPPSTPVFRVNPGIVYLDVVVRDRNHQLVTGLTQADFRVFENGQPQTIDAFRAVTQPAPRPASAIFTTDAPASAIHAPDTINLILFDLLDTSPIDQVYARNQMLKFLQALPPGLRIGLFVLTDHDLRRVQELTGSSSQLAAAAKTLMPESGPLYQSASAQAHSNDATGSMPGLATPKGSDDSMIQDLARDLASENFQHGQERSEFAAEAFRALTKAVEGMNGRKNLFWLAGSFPLDAHATILTGSRIAVYPISVLGMQTNSIHAEMNGNGVTAGAADAQSGGRLGAQTSQQDADRGELRQRAQDIAAQTGGQAFVDGNDIAGALRRALEGGENYYSLVYSPTDKNMNGKFRKVRVALAGKGYALSYRQGYFAVPAK